MASGSPSAVRYLAGCQAGLGTTGISQMVLLPLSNRVPQSLAGVPFFSQPFQGVTIAPTWRAYS